MLWLWKFNYLEDTVHKLLTYPVFKKPRVKDNVVERVDGKINERILNAEERAKLLVIKTRVRDQLKLLREKEIEKKPRVVNTIKDRYDLTDEDIKEFFRDADEGIVDLEELKEKSPINIGLIEKVTKITVEIKELNQEIRNLSWWEKTLLIIKI